MSEKSQYILTGRGAKVQIGAAKLDALPMPKRALEGTMSWSENTGIGKEESRKVRQKLAFPLLVLAAVFWWQSRAARQHVAQELEEMHSSGIVPPGHFALLTWYCDWAPLDTFLTKGVARFILGWGYGLEKRLQVLNSMAYTLSLVVVWTIESFRRGNVLSVANMFPSILLSLAQFSSSGLIAPIYFFFHYVQSPQENYAALDNRLTNTAFAKTALLTFLLVLVGPAVAIFPCDPDAVQWIYACFGFLYPVYLPIVQRILMLFVKDTTRLDRLYRPTADLPYLRFTYGVCTTLCIAPYAYASYISPTSILESIVSKVYNVQRFVTSGPATNADLLDFSTLATFAAAFYWVLLSFVDLKGTGRLKTSWFTIISLLAVSTVVGGPGSAVLIMWAWREEIMAKKIVLEN